MKKTLILAFIITSLSISGFTQSLSLESVCESLSSHPNTTGDFAQTKTLQANGRKLKSSGKYIICTEGILWQTEKPIPSSLILTKDTMVQISANGTKSVMSGKDNQIFANISDTLSSVFSGNVESLKKNFIYDFTDDGKGTWIVVLTPKDSTISSVMKTLTLSGISDASGAAMTCLVMAESSGNSITYDFLNQKYPKELSADEKQIFITE